MSLVEISKLQIIVLLLFVLPWAELPAQVTLTSHPITRELHFNYDNDLVFGTDQFYTSGVNIFYSRLISKGSDFYAKFNSKKSDTLKVITRYQYGHKIITGEDIDNREIVPNDQPYAGWHYLKFHLINFPAQNSRNQYSITLGYVGEGSGIGNFHKWWHNWLNIESPKGWQYEIANEPVLNLQYQRMYYMEPLRNVGFSTESTFEVGNGMNRASQSVLAKYGRSGRLVNSGLGDSRMSASIPKVGNNDPEEEEGFIYYKLEAHAVASNILIQGSLFNDKSPHTEEIEHFYVSREWGFMYTNYYTTFMFAFHRIGKQIVGGKKHRYFSLHLIKRF